MQQGGIKRRGLMLVLSSPSGAGKTTIARKLMELDENLTISVSSTTRVKRPSEIDGTDYHFVSEERFEEMVDRDEFLEHATVFNHCYGTPRAPVEAALAEGRDVLFDIDWQGTQQLAEKARKDLVSVFVLPPSTVELERRLRSRAQDSDVVVRDRMAKNTAIELSHWAEYDYILVNEDVEQSVTSVQSLLHAERLRRERQVGLSDFVETLRQGR